jgi:hypothetical protein
MNRCHKWYSYQVCDEGSLHIGVKLVRMNQVHPLLSQQMFELNGPAPIGHTLSRNDERANSLAFAPFLKPPRAEQAENGSISLWIKRGSQITDNALSTTRAATGR